MEVEKTAIPRGVQQSLFPLESLPRSFASENPELVGEWCYSENGDADPYMVKPFSNKLYTWCCGKEGHLPWKATPNNRSRKKQCPYCSGRRPVKGVTDLATVNPFLASEFHPTKNLPLTADAVCSASDEKVWWLCSFCGHEWEAKVCNRSSGAQCPKCTKEGRTSFPEQALFFYLKKLFGSAVNSHKICGRKEIDVYIEELKVGVEYDGRRWHKKPERDLEKNLWCKERGIELIRIREKGCPALDDGTYCISLENGSTGELERAIKKAIDHITRTDHPIVIDIAKDRPQILAQFVQSSKENSLAAVNPEVAKEFHPTKNPGLTADMLTASSGKLVWWLCSVCGHEWQTSPAHRNSDGSGCPERYRKGRSKHLEATAFQACG
jgi:DNA-directed RNA polymerase subunit RPC12/RpoP